MLCGASGWAHPGEVVGLLGPSGAGKSTLLDILSQRKTQGRTQGSVLCNGKPLGLAFKRSSAYVPQVRAWPHGDAACTRSIALRPLLQSHCCMVGNSPSNANHAGKPAGP